MPGALPVRGGLLRIRVGGALTHMVRDVLKDLDPIERVDSVGRCRPYDHDFRLWGDENELTVGTDADETVVASGFRDAPPEVLVIALARVLPLRERLPWTAVVRISGSGFDGPVMGNNLSA